MRFQIHPWNGTLALLDVRSTSAGIPPRKMRCKFIGWSLGSVATLFGSSSTWTAKDLETNTCTQLVFNRLETESMITTHKPASQPLYAQRVLLPVVQYALLGSSDDTARAVAAGKHQNLQRAFVQHDWEVGLQESEIKFISWGNRNIKLTSECTEEIKWRRKSWARWNFTHRKCKYTLDTVCATYKQATLLIETGLKGGDEVRIRKLEDDDPHVYIEWTTCTVPRYSPMLVWMCVKRNSYWTWK